MSDKKGMTVEEMVGLSTAILKANSKPISFGKPKLIFPDEDAFLKHQRDAINNNKDQCTRCGLYGFLYFYENGDIECMYCKNLDKEGKYTYKWAVRKDDEGVYEGMYLSLIHI